MIDDHQSEVIVIIGLPEFRRYPQVVETIVRHELIATDLVPLFHGLDSRRAERVDPKPDRRAPRHCILDELHLLAIESKKKRARTFQTLLGDDFLIALDFEVSADGPVGPNDEDHVRARLFAETEVKQRSGNRLFLD